MPGHKGAFLPCPELAPLARLDVTEIPSTGNLYEDLSPIREAQALWARPHGSGVLPVSHRRLHHGYPYRSDPVLSPGGAGCWWTGAATAPPSTPWLFWIWTRYFFHAPGWRKRGCRPVFPPGCEKNAGSRSNYQNCLYYITNLLRIVVGYSRHCGSSPRPRWKTGGGRCPRSPSAIFGDGCLPGSGRGGGERPQDPARHGAGGPAVHQRHRPGTGAANCRYLRHLQPLLPHPGLPGHGS